VAIEACGLQLIQITSRRSGHRCACPYRNTVAWSRRHRRQQPPRKSMSTKSTG